MLIGEIFYLKSYSIVFNILGKTSSEALTVLKSVHPFGFYRRNSVSHQVGNLAALVATSKKVVVFGGEHHKIEDPSPLTLFVLGIFFAESTQIRRNN